MGEAAGHLGENEMWGVKEPVEKRWSQVWFRVEVLVLVFRGKGLSNGALRQKCQKRISGCFALFCVLDVLGRSLGWRPSGLETHCKPRALAWSG